MTPDNIFGSWKMYIDIDGFGGQNIQLYSAECVKCNVSINGYSSPQHVFDMIAKMCQCQEAVQWNAIHLMLWLTEGLREHLGKTANLAQPDASVCHKDIHIPTIHKKEDHVKSRDWCTPYYSSRDLEESREERREELRERHAKRLRSQKLRQSPYDDTY